MRQCIDARHTIVESTGLSLCRAIPAHDGLSRVT
jgi:hypothetical protein